MNDRSDDPSHLEQTLLSMELNLALYEMVPLFCRFVYSASINTVIIKWEVQTLKRVQQMEVKDIKCLRSLRLQDNMLWCGKSLGFVFIKLNYLEPAHET